MRSPSSANVGPSPEFDESHDPRRWLYVGLAALFVLIGLAIVLDVAASLWRGQLPSWSLSSDPWDWIIGLIGLLIALWIVVWILRLIFWGIWGSHYEGRRWRHYYRHYYARGPFDSDPAVEIARERFARGEITQEQLDQMLRQLNRGSGPLPP
jgi:uncharacterized membrane protein